VNRFDLKTLISTLNPTCRQALEDAAGLCVKLGHHTIEVEHVLHKLLDKRNTDLRAVLTHYGIDRKVLQSELDQALYGFRSGNSKVPTFSDQVPRMLREAWMVASLQLKSARVRSGAVLVAIRTVEGLRDLMVQSAPSLRRVSATDLRRELPDLVRNTIEARSAAAGPNSAPPPIELATTDGRTDTPSLDQYTVDLTSKAKAGEIDPIIGRDGEIRQMIDILARRRQNNPILTGEAGVGKTAVVEGLARRIASGDVPPRLRNVELRSLDLALLQAGAGVQGEFEQRLKSVIDEVQGSVRPVILFIDEAHTLIGAGGAAGMGDAANLLKPALARGKLRTIAATTWSEYKRYFETDAALARRFQVVKIEEPDGDTAVAMLRGLVPHLERHHNVRVLDEAVQDAVILSQRYLTGRKLPDKAIGVLDTAAARVGVVQRSTPGVVEDAARHLERLQVEVSRLEREQETHGDHRERLSHLLEAVEEARRAHTELESRWHAERQKVERIKALESKLETRHADGEGLRGQLLAERENLALLQGAHPMVPLDVDRRVVASVVADWTGVPVGKMLTDEVGAVLRLGRTLNRRVIGQNQSLDAIARRIRTSRAGLEDPNKPVGVFLLAGPSGVGKTETAAALADTLFGGADNMVTINMSEYQEPHSVSQLKGAPPGYVGYGRGGVLTEAVRRRPYTLVLLDEVEKAHPDVLELFFQVFDKGTLEDGEGNVIDFRNTVILLTSNVGDHEIERACEGGERPSVTVLRALLRPALLARFPAALLGRMVTVPYYPLRAAELLKIARLKLNHICKRYEATHGAVLGYAPAVLGEIIDRCTEGHTGARNIDAILTQALLPALSSAVLERIANGIDATGVRITVDHEGAFQFEATDEPLRDDDHLDPPLDGQRGPAAEPEPPAAAPSELPPAIQIQPESAPPEQAPAPPSVPPHDEAPPAQAGLWKRFMGSVSGQPKTPED
jgi:type VI secretion system protein VasG